MQNRYIADVGDFGKYGMLRFLVKSTGLKLGVNWYLVDPEELNEHENNHGGITDYIKKPEFQGIDNILLNKLQFLIEKRDNGEAITVANIGKKHILSAGTLYFDESLTYQRIKGPAKKKKSREDWFKESCASLKNCDIIFLDPDNGLETAKLKRYNKKGIKYVFLEEAKGYYDSGKSLIIYNHFSREKKEQFIHRFDSIRRLLQVKYLDTLYFEKRIPRHYIFLPQIKHKPVIETFFKAFLESKWNACFHRDSL